MQANCGDDDPVCYALDNLDAPVERSMCDTRGVTMQANRCDDPRVAMAGCLLLFRKQQDRAARCERTLARATLCVMVSITLMRTLCGACGAEICVREKKNSSGDIYLRKFIQNL